MKTILVPAGGGESDQAVFATALAVAKPLAAHLDFYHVLVGPGEAAVNTPHADFAMGPGLWTTLDQAWTEAATRSAAARAHVEDFCRRNAVPFRNRPSELAEISASWSTEEGESMPLLIRRARHSDLVVLGRQSRHDQLPKDLLERLLLQSGRPILAVPTVGKEVLCGTSMVCWKECGEAARAVTAAMPLLKKAQRVVIVTVAERGDARAPAAAGELADSLAWHGIRAEARAVSANGSAVADTLAAAAAELAPDLIVMGGYGHNRIREIIFGGCTDAFLRARDRAVLLVH